MIYLGDDDFFMANKSLGDIKDYPYGHLCRFSYVVLRTIFYILKNNKSLNKSIKFFYRVDLTE